MKLFGWGRKRDEKLVESLGLDQEEMALLQLDLQRGDQAGALARIAAAQEKQRAAFEATTGVDSRMVIPEIGQNISWADVVRQVFKVHEFDRAGTTIGPNDQVEKQGLGPYGYLLIESPILSQRARLPIIHSDDFLLATTVFDEPRLAALLSEAELLVTYAPERVLPKGLSGSFRHVLHYVIVPLGTLNRYYSSDGDRHMASPAPDKLFGQFVYAGEIKVKVVPQPGL